jgi:hypothetical protein
VRGEVRAEAAGAEEFAEGLVGRRVPGGQHAPRGAVEAGDLGEYVQVAGPAAVSEAGSQAGQAAVARVLQAAAGAADRHAHLRGLGEHPELGEQPGEQRVGVLVVDDEAGVHADRGAGRWRDKVGVGVAAEPPVGLEDRYVISM